MPKRHRQLWSDYFYPYMASDTSLAIRGGSRVDGFCWLPPSDYFAQGTYFTP